jgi:hypothetical protein
LKRGVAVSDLQNVARMQRQMNDMSELGQMVRGANHKTLVKNRGDDVSTGAGGVIVMHEDTVPEKRPYLLQAYAEALLGLLQAIEMKVERINRMAHLTPVRAKEVTAKIGSPTLQREIDRQLARVVLERDDVLEVVEGELGGGDSPFFVVWVCCCWASCSAGRVAGLEGGKN